YGANAVCDGKNFWATIAELPGQVLKTTAPATLTVEDVYSNEVLFDQMAGRVAGPSVPLSFLLEPNQLQFILLEADEPKLLPAATIDGARCRGVSIHRKDGDLVFWIDEAGYEIRRIEFPTTELLEELRKQGGKITDLSLVAEIKGAKLGAKVEPVAFRFEAPSGAKIVGKFAPVAEPQPPSRLLGTKIGDFRFVSLDGTPITPDSLSGKVVVVDFWATWCGPCFQTLPELQKVYDRYREHDRVTILAVSLDRSADDANAGSSSNPAAQTPAATDDEVREAFARAKLNIPIARDPAQQASSIFGVEQIPNMFILGPDGTVEDHEVGANPSLADELPGRIEKLLVGGSLHAEALRRYDERRRQYDAQIQAAATPPSTSGGTSAAPSSSTTGGEQFERGAIAPRSEPANLKIARRWSCTSLKQPGNVLTTDDGGVSRTFVIDGLTTIAELDINGNVTATHALDLPKQPEEGIVAALRTIVDRDGRRWYLGLASSRQQLHLFDESWKRVLSYPDSTTAGGVADALLEDLDGDGRPDISVGFYDVVGVQNVSFEGQRQWSNRSISNVLSLATTEPDGDGKRRLLCAHERGTLVPIDSQGHEQPPITVGQRFVRYVKTADLDGDGRMEMFAIATTGLGQDTAIGIDRSGRELWSLPMARGLQPVPSLEPVVAGIFAPNHQRQWIVAGSDGSISVVAADGKVIDRWNHGAAISGLAAAPERGLIIATAGGVELWQADEQHGNE
ncbi:MAG TPA: TlpA disulfide reductase family protein, partial [Pirellulales bacterium]|nr:TlpA disulfide reductase family protein [Pirellulales bacterium]